MKDLRSWSNTNKLQNEKIIRKFNAQVFDKAKLKIKNTVSYLIEAVKASFAYMHFKKAVVRKYPCARKTEKSKKISFSLWRTRRVRAKLNFELTQNGPEEI